MRNDYKDRPLGLKDDSWVDKAALLIKRACVVFIIAAGLWVSVVMFLSL